MSNHKTEDAACLLGGALLGAAAMYLLDPELGQKRRRRAANAASDTVENAGDYLSEGWDHVRSAASDLGGRAADLRDRAYDRVSDLADQFGGQAQKTSKQARKAATKAGKYGNSLSDRARSVASRLSDRASDLMGRASDYASRFGDASSDWAHSARKTISDTYGRARDYADDTLDDAADYRDDLRENVRDTGSHWYDQVRGWTSKAASQAKDYLPSLISTAKSAGKQASKAGSKSVRRVSNAMDDHEGFGAGSFLGTAVGCVAVGAACMYFFDPDRGRARRTWCQQKVGSLVHQTGKSMRATGENLANHMKGMGYEARGKMRSAKADARTIAARVRSELGHWVSHPRLIDVTADTGGSVTVAGLCLRNEADVLLAAIAKVPGICQIVNRLDLRDSLSDRDITQANAGSTSSPGGVARVPQM
jgi:gas vesicle protein